MMQSMQDIKGRWGYLVNQKTEPWFGVHVSLQRSFPYLKISRLLRERFLTVRIDIVNRCNLRCKMCYFSLDEVRNKPRIEMSAQLFQKIAKDLFPLASQLIVSAGAEPLCAKNFPRMLEIAAPYEIPHTAFFTNATLLNQENIPTIIRAGVNVITVSFDGATPQTFEAVRRGADFEKVVENIRLLQKIKKQLGHSTPAIHFGVVLMKSNIRELPDILRMAKELGVARVTASHLIPYTELGSKEESLNPCRELANTCLDEARNTAQELAMPFDAPPNFPKTSERQQPSSPLPPKRLECYWPWREILIRPDGSVQPCCYWYEDTSMGEFTGNRFTEIWFGPRYQRLREELTHQTFRNTCAQCPGMNPVTEKTQEASEIQIVGS
ncbi:MAG: radical SAM protein [bacterium]|nr:radical SAM protein [bacterium]